MLILSLYSIIITCSFLAKGLYGIDRKTNQNRTLSQSEYKQVIQRSTEKPPECGTCPKTKLPK